MIRLIVLFFRLLLLEVSNKYIENINKSLRDRTLSMEEGCGGGGVGGVGVEGFSGVMKYFKLKY